jgi:GT2 family glycosyltransferase
VTPSPGTSVIVPTHDRPEALRRCLDALAEVEAPPGGLEVVVVDDGGRRAARLTCAPLGAVVRVLEQEQRGPAAARNAGARAARGEVLAFLDDDCEPAPSWLVRLTSRLPEWAPAAVGGPLLNAWPENPWAAGHQVVLDALVGHFNADCDRAGFLLTANLALNRTAFDAVGGFDERFPLPAAEDRDFSERLRGAQVPLLFEPAAGVRHQHDRSPGGLWRRHHAYGRGATMLRRFQRERGEAPAARQPGVHRHMVAALAAHRRPAPWRRVAGAALLTQAAYVSGALTESVSASPGTWGGP